MMRQIGAGPARDLAQKAPRQSACEKPAEFFGHDAWSRSWIRLASDTMTEKRRDVQRRAVAPNQRVRRVGAKPSQDASTPNCRPQGRNPPASDFLRCTSGRGGNLVPTIAASMQTESAGWARWSP